MSTNFETETIKAFGYNIPLVTTLSRHYAIPPTKVQQLISSFDRNVAKKVSITLIMSNEKSNEVMALKLHQQFYS